MKIIQFFSAEQLAWLKAEGIVLADQEYTDDEIIGMIERLEDLLTEKGIENNEENAYGNICVDILCVFGDNT